MKPSNEPLNLAASRGLARVPRLAASRLPILAVLVVLASLGNLGSATAAPTPPVSDALAEPLAESPAAERFNRASVSNPRATDIEVSEPTRVDPAEYRRFMDDVSASVPSQDDPFAVVDACIAQEMEATGTPGASLAIAANGVITYTNAFGVRSLESQVPVDPMTQFRIGSTTKMMTAAAVLQLVESGDVDLDAPVTNYLSNLTFAEPWNASSLTLRHLLSHTGGLLDGYYISDPTIPLATWSTVLAGLPLNAQPGFFWNYSNPNFSLAGLVVQEVSGVAYEDYMAANVFAPAGLDRTTLDVDAVEAAANYATGHVGTTPVPIGAFDIPAVAPAGTAFSIPVEMAAWALTLGSGGGEVLTEPSAQLLQSRVVPMDYVPWMHYGLGVFVTDYRSIDEPDVRVTVREHGGNTQGFSSQLYWIPEQGFAVSILANTATSLAYSAHCALEAFAGVEPIPVSSQPAEPDEWGRFAGTYSMLDLALAPTTAQVRHLGDRLSLDLVEAPGTLVLDGSQHLLPVFNRTFLGDENLDGDPDGFLDFTFIDHDHLPATYLRQRYAVGELFGQLPSSVDLNGDECALVELEAARNFGDVSVEATGLTPYGTIENRVIEQDAVVTYDFQVRERADLLHFTLTSEPDDTITMLLMHDANSDGEFDFPSEAIGQGQPHILTRDPTHQILFQPGTASPGAYQIQVHGSVVNGDDSTFDLEMRVVEGNDLTVEAAPTSLVKGQSSSFSVCASATGSYSEPRMGTVTIGYGSPPRVVRVMVEWRPLSIYLPATYMRHAIR